MTELEKEIETLDAELGKLKAQRSVAQMDASSGESIYTNIRMIMKHMDDAPMELQKSLLRMLIHNIVINEQTVEIDMYIQPECLPTTLAQLPLNEENPTLTNGQDEVLASDASVSTERPIWGE